ncbi:MAG: DUF4278 domain-containing protein [Calothrix sp. MO_167.B12]|nr:DUF4278 domain-containing protein [Calothrix sp. MO_167.B12]
MKLQYRGISYQSHPHNMTSTTSEITAKFRGLIYYIQQPLKTYLHSVNILRYRGVDYIKSNQKKSLSNSEFRQREEMNLLDNNYSLREDATKFISDLNKFNF